MDVARSPLNPERKGLISPYFEPFRPLLQKMEHHLKALNIQRYLGNKSGKTSPPTDPDGVLYKEFVALLLEAMKNQDIIDEQADKVAAKAARARMSNAEADVEESESESEETEYESEFVYSG